ncbi:Zn-dependent exopeptidase, partial [Violaceomyces palustris]
MVPRRLPYYASLASILALGVALALRIPNESNPQLSPKATQRQHQQQQPNLLEILSGPPPGSSDHLNQQACLLHHAGSFHVLPHSSRAADVLNLWTASSSCDHSNVTKKPEGWEKLAQIPSQTLRHVLIAAREIVVPQESSSEPLQTSTGQAQAWMYQMAHLVYETSSSESLQDEPTSSRPLVWQQSSLYDIQLGSEQQQGLFEHDLSDKVKLIHLEPNFAIFVADDQGLSLLDSILPPDTRLNRLSLERRRASPSANEVASPSKPEPLFEKPRYNPLVDTIISSDALSIKNLRADVRILTGEDRLIDSVGWKSRHSSTYGARKAAEWIKGEMTKYLGDLPGAKCSLQEYEKYFSPNVVCVIPATEGGEGSVQVEGGKEEEEGIVLISAHYDSRGSFGLVDAPGGDDDGSGTTALLGIARSIGRFKIDFASEVHLVAFSGEEQGLVGSQHYAKRLDLDRSKVKLALQMDMLAYRKQGEPLQIAFPDKLATVSATKHVQRIAQTY